MTPQQDVLDRLAARAQIIRPDRDDLVAADARRTTDELWHSWEEWIERRRGRVAPTESKEAVGTCLHTYCSKPGTRVLGLAEYRRYLPLRGVNEAHSKFPDVISLCGECYQHATGASS